MKKKKICAAGMAVMTALMLSLAACGTGGESADSDSSAATDGYVWVPEYVELPEDTDIYNVVIRGDSMYVVSNDWDDNGNQEGISYKQISLTDGSVTKVFSREQESADAEEGGSSYRYTNYYDVTTDCSGLITVEGVYSYNDETGESTSNYYLCRYSTDGERVYEVDITSEVDPDGYGAGYVQKMLIDGSDRICIALEGTLLLYDADGNMLGEITLDTSNGWIQSMGRGGDGQVYVSFYDYGSGSGSYCLLKVDFDEQNANTKYENIPADASYMAPGQDETTIILASSDAVYQYDLTTQTSEELFSWLDCDIYGSYVGGIATTDDGRLIALMNDWETNDYEVVYLTKTEAGQVAQKTQIVIGTLYDTYSLKSQVVKFNKSNDQYHVTLKSYVDYTNAQSDEDYQNADSDGYTRLINEITSGDCPDLLLLDSVNVEQLAAKDVFEDLSPYLESSTAVSRADYFENILAAYTYNDKLVGIPDSFYLETIAGKTADVGENPGWTLDELMAYANEHPDTQIFEYSTKAYMLQTLISYNQGKYIDWETGTCSFDQDEFIKVLEFANSFPDEYNYDEDEPSTPTKLASGQLLLEMESIYEPSDMQMAEAEFGEDVTYIGFPNEDGTSGTYLSCSTPIAILAKSEHKDVAWAFLESCLTADNDLYSYGFSAQKAKFEEQLAESMTTDYTDENGNPYLNDEGLALTGGGMSYGDNDWSYYYRVTTEEEAQLLRNMIDTAQPSNSMDSEILSIISEEADSYFSGDKSAADTAAVIQSRVQIYINESN